MAATLDQVTKLYELPFLDLVYQAATVHRQTHDPNEVQLCTLLSIKTGGCPENCGYCSQSARFKTDVKRESLLSVDDVLAKARQAKESGSTRFCMGAAWRGPNNPEAFDRVLEMIQGINALGMESCVTLGMLTQEQAIRLRHAGLKAYNHNLDTSASHYPIVVTTHTYQDRLTTLKYVAEAGISLCCGGILGIGESREDRINFLHTIANLEPPPESIPINKLVPIEGTPLADSIPVDIFEWIRVIAVARILVPKALIRLSAGRLEMTEEAQALAHLAGASSIFTGDKLLTTPNPETHHDLKLLRTLGLKPRPPYRENLGSVSNPG